MPTLHSPFQYRVKSAPKPPKVGESYFATCERDEGGRCLPSGEAGDSSKGSGTRIVVNSDERYEVEFDTTIGKYAVSAQLMVPVQDDNWNVSFSLSKPRGKVTTKLTGEAGSAAVRVMRTVGDVLANFISDKRPSKFKFTADSKESSRVRLYDKVSEQIAKKYGYSLDRVEGKEVVYQFTRNSSDGETGGEQGNREPTEKDKERLGFAAKLVQKQTLSANATRKSQGKPPLEFELKLVPVNSITPSQSGEDYDNDSSRELAKYIADPGTSGRDLDYAPVAVDETGTIIDGNHRHAAHTFAGLDWIPALVPKNFSGRGEKAFGKHKLGCLLAVLSESLRKDLTDWSLENIPEFHLAKGGRELRHHVTIKYGFKDSSEETIEALRAMVRDPILITLKGLSLFRGNEDGDVLKIDVDSPQLHALNAQITSVFPCETKYPDYHPHVTIAYLDPSVAERYAAFPFPFSDRMFQLHDAEFGASDGTVTEIPLTILNRFGVKEWVTMGGGPCEDGGGQHCGGSPVEIDQSGEIRKGPKGTVGKKPSELKERKKPKPPKVKPRGYDDAPLDLGEPESAQQGPDEGLDLTREITLVEDEESEEIPEVSSKDPPVGEYQAKLPGARKPRNVTLVGRLTPFRRKKSLAPPRVKSESYFGSCERDDEGHCLPSGQAGEGGKKPAKRGRKPKPRLGDDVSSGYVEAFNESKLEEITEEELSTANQEMEDDGSEYRMIYQEERQRWEAWTPEELEEEYGSSDSHSRKNPKTGKWETASPDFFEEEGNPSEEEIVEREEPEADEEVWSYLEALEETGASDEELQQINQELIDFGSDWVIEFNETDGFIPIRHSPEGNKGGLEPPKVKPSPFGEQKSLVIPHVKYGFTGERRDKLGHNNCYANGVKVPCRDENKTPKPQKKESTELLRRQVSRAVMSSMVKAGHAALSPKRAAEAAAKRVGNDIWSKMSPNQQKAAARTMEFVKGVEHLVMTGFRKSRELAVAAARERGVSEKQSEQVGKILATVDLVTSWTVNMPAAYALTGSAGAAKVASWIPVASLAYLGYSTARDPFATIRAARQMVRKGGSHKAMEINDPGSLQLAGDLTDRLTQSKDPDWYCALFSAALDMTQDPRQALAMADEMVKQGMRGEKSIDPEAERVLSTATKLASSGMVPLHRLGSAIGGSPEQLHQTLTCLWRAGKISMAAFEGRHGITPEERRWLMKEPGGSRELGFVLLKS